MSTLVERAKESARYAGMSLVKWQESLGLSNAHFYNTGGLSRKVARVIEQKYPDINIEWLATGNGEMLNGQKTKEELKGFLVPLLPIAAQCSMSTGFEELIKTYDCEMVLSPISNTSLAITINGDSMSPEFPNGSKIFIKKVDKAAFIEWGNTYVLDTNNGIIVKNIYPISGDETQIICRSVNPNFSDFKVRIEDIRGWYRVRCCLTIK